MPVVQRSWTLLVLACGFLARSTSPDLFSQADDSTEEVCVSAFIYVEEYGNDVRVMGVSEGEAAYEIVRLTNYSLPTTGCKPNFEHCDLNCFTCTEGEGEEGGDSKCCTFPVVNETGRNELALLQLHWSVNEQSESPYLKLQGLTNISHRQDCVTAHTYYFQRSNQHYVDCINTTANTTGDLAYLLFFSLSYDSAEIGTTAELQPASFVRFFNFSDALSLSETLYVQQSNRDGCPALQNFFFVSTSKGYTVGVGDNDEGVESAARGYIADCEVPLDIGYLKTPHNGLLLRVQCSQYITKLFTACSTQVVIATYDSRINGTIYQCTKGDTLQANLTLRDDYITASGNLQDFGNINVSHYFPFTVNISYAFCNIGSDVSFVFGHHNGSVFSLSFTSGKISTIAHNSCDNSTDTYVRGHCYKARKTHTPGIIVAYDYQDSSFKVANLSCSENPVVESVTLHPRPPMVTFLPCSGATCDCRNNSNDDVETSSIIFDSTSHHSLTVGPNTRTQTLAGMSSPVMSITSSPAMSSSVIPPTPSNSPKKCPELLALVALIIIPIIIIIIIIFIVMCVKKKWWRKYCLRKKTSSFELTGVTSNNVHDVGVGNGCAGCADGTDSSTTVQNGSKEGSPSTSAATPLLSSSVVSQQGNPSASRLNDPEQSVTTDVPTSSQHPSSLSSPTSKANRSLGPNPGLLLSVNDRTLTSSPGEPASPLSQSAETGSSSPGCVEPPARVSDSPSSPSIFPPPQHEVVADSTDGEICVEPPVQGQDVPPRRYESASAQDTQSESRNSQDCWPVSNVHQPVNVTPTTERGGGPSAQVLVPGGLRPHTLSLQQQLPQQAQIQQHQQLQQPQQHQLLQQPQQQPVAQQVPSPDPDTGQSPHVQQN